MQIRDMRTADIDSVFQLLCANGWAARLGDSKRFAALIAHTQRAAVAEDGGQVVGFARGITDYLSNGYLSMVVVADTHRRRGIGRALVDHVVGDDPRITWILRAGRDYAADFFASLGFAPSDIAMERTRAG
jgi:ribosomal protein S18 acetylase RimI-like enzyme